jgi:hypothetical protein
MNTYVAEIDSEEIVAFRKASSARKVAASRSFCVIYFGLLRADGRLLWDGPSPIRYRFACPREHERWLILRDSRAEDPDDWVVYLVPFVSIDHERPGDDRGAFRNEGSRSLVRAGSKANGVWEFVMAQRGVAGRRAHGYRRMNWSSFVVRDQAALSRGAVDRPPEQPTILGPKAIGSRRSA